MSKDVTTYQDAVAECWRYYIAKSYGQKEYNALPGSHVPMDLDRKYYHRPLNRHSRYRSRSRSRSQSQLDAFPPTDIQNHHSVLDFAHTPDHLFTNIEVLSDHAPVHFLDDGYPYQTTNFAPDLAASQTLKDFTNSHTKDLAHAQDPTNDTRKAHEDIPTSHAPNHQEDSHHAHQNVSKVLYHYDPKTSYQEAHHHTKTIHADVTPAAAQSILQLPV